MSEPILDAFAGEAAPVATLAEEMRWVLEHAAERKEKGTRAALRREMDKNFGRYMDRLAKLEGAPAVKKAVVVDVGECTALALLDKMIGEFEAQEVARKEGAK